MRTTAVVFALCVALILTTQTTSEKTFVIFHPSDPSALPAIWRPLVTDNARTLTEVASLHSPKQDFSSPTVTGPDDQAGLGRALNSSVDLSEADGHQFAHYPSRTSALRAETPSSYECLVTGGYFTFGDGGNGTYCRSNANPGQTGAAFEDAHGQWWALQVREIIPAQWGALCDGSGDDALGLQNALTYLGSQNKFLTLDGGGLACKLSTGLYVESPGSLTGNIAGGAGYAGHGSGFFVNVPLSGGSGTGAQAKITIAKGAVVDVTFTSFGSGYSVRDVLSASNLSLGGAGSGFSFTVASIGSTQWQSYRRRITNLNLTASKGFSNSKFFLDFSTLTAAYPVNDLDIDNSYFYGGVQGSGYAGGGIKFSNTFGGHIHHNHIEGVRNWGILRSATTAAGELLIDHNIIRGDGVDAMHGVDLWGYDSTVDHNIISDADCGLISEQGSNYFDNNHLYNYQFQDSTCGFSSRGSQDTFTGNILDMVYVEARSLQTTLVQHNMFRVQFSMPNGPDGGGYWCAVYLAPQSANAGSLGVSFENNAFVNIPPAPTTLTGSIAEGSNGQGILTVTNVSTGKPGEGQFLTGAQVAENTLILSQLSGSPGGVGAYAVNKSQSVAPTTMKSTNITIYDFCVNKTSGSYASTNIFQTYIRNNNYYGWLSLPRTSHPKFAMTLANGASTAVDATPQLIPNFGSLRYVLNGAFSQTAGSPGGFWFSLPGSNVIDGTVERPSAGAFHGEATINNAPY